MIRSSSAIVLVLASALVLVFVAAACGFDGEAGSESSVSSTSPPPGTSAPSSTTSPTADAGVGGGGPIGTPVCTDDVLSFDGVDDVATAPADGALNLDGDFTIEAWIKPTAKALTSTMTLVSHTNGSTGWVLQIVNGHVQCEIYGHDAFFFVATDTSGGAGAAYVTADAWAYVAATLQGGTLRLYFNGKLVDSQGEDFTFGRTNDDGVLALGSDASSPGDFYEGELDDVRLSNTAKYTGTSMNRPDIPLAVEADTVALWHFDEGSGSALVDSVGKHGASMGPGTAAPTRTTAPCAASR